ncbi:DUF3461 family protein [Marinobacterium arenosum]|uniref:DUF3461 family protein n=1 Tax=Marinobacterium arenosum TaxID=2862496 RepID=UPI001C9540BD|nr:DUF3461 family protein [Marinobacterium arenosum]MBY4678932.1 DUF3461 family protein [Marinobacterium arenosum]
MSDYPTLTKMGIKSVEAVEKYTLRQEGNADVLKIYYKRPKGSFLSRSKKFTFVRGRQAIPMQARGAEGYDQVKKISPMLLQALEELKALEAKRQNVEPVDPKERFLANLDHLEKVMHSKIEEMRRQINEIE